MVRISLEDTLKTEMLRGFDTKDEFREVMRDIAMEYNTSTFDVLTKYYKVRQEANYEVHSN